LKKFEKIRIDAKALFTLQKMRADYKERAISD